MINVIDMCEENFIGLMNSKKKSDQNVELIVVERRDDEFIAGDYLGINETYQVDEDIDTVTTDYTGRSALVRIISVDKPYYLKQGYIRLILNFCDVTLTPEECQPQTLDCDAPPSTSSRKPKLDLMIFGQ